MTQKFYYELRPGVVQVYDEDMLPLSGEEPHLRYIGRRKLANGADEKSLQQLIADILEHRGKRIKHRDTPQFAFVAVHFSRDSTSKEQLPSIEGTYKNPYYSTHYYRADGIHNESGKQG